MFYILTRENCHWCDVAKETLKRRGEPYEAFLYTEHPLLLKLLDKAGLKTVPQIWHDSTFVGGCAALYDYLSALDEDKARGSKE